MTTQTQLRSNVEAERLADALQAEFPGYGVSDVAAAELRRLVSFNQQLMDEVARLRQELEFPQKREPLTDEKNSKLFDSLIDEMLNHSYQGSHEAAENAADELRRMYKAAYGITKGGEA